MVLESQPKPTRANQSQPGASQIQPKPGAAGASQSQPIAKRPFTVLSFSRDQSKKTKQSKQGRQAKQSKAATVLRNKKRACMNHIPNLVFIVRVSLG